MTDIGKGTPVIFVGPDDNDDPSGLTLNALYFVEGMRRAMSKRVCPMCGSNDVISLRGVSWSTGYRYNWFCPGAFRPLRGDAEEVKEEIEEFV